MKRKIVLLIPILMLLFSGKVDNSIVTTNTTYKDPNESSRFFIKNNFIRTGYSLNTIENLSENFMIDTDKIQFNCNGSNQSYIGTGCTIDVADADIINAYKMIVYGDVNGDGNSSLTDIVKIARYLGKKEQFDEYYQMAADVDQDDSVSLRDAVMLGTVSLQDKNVPIKSEEDNTKTVITLDRQDIILNKNDSIKINPTTNKESVIITDYKSDNEKVATVDSDGTITAIGSGSTKITVIASDDTEEYLTVKVGVKTTGVTLDKSFLSLNVDKSAKITATVSPYDATDKTVNFVSGDATIATVDNNGVVKALREGTTIITVTTLDGSKATAVVSVSKEVKEVTEIRLDQTAIEMYENDKTKITSTVLPSNATDKTVTYVSSDNSVATVDSTGEVTAVSNGISIITVTAKNGVSATVKITVTSKQQTNPDASEKSLTLNKSLVNINVGETIALVPTVVGIENPKVTFTSNAPSIASVDEYGKVLGVAGGKAIITAKVEGEDNLVAQTVVTVGEEVSKIILNNTSLTLNANDKATLQATVIPVGATDKTLTWYSSNNSVVTVSDTGEVTALRGGSATITVTSKNGITARCNVIVTESVNELIFSTDEVTIEKGESTLLMIAIYPTTATDKTLEFESSSENIATVDSTGKVVGISNGKTKITAKAKSGAIATIDVIVTSSATNVSATDFSKLDSCNSNSTIKTANGVALHKCIQDFNVYNLNHGSQNFAINKDYVYFAYPQRGFVNQTDYSESEALELTSKTRIVAVNRSDSTFQLMYLNYAGHGQAFDASETDNRLFVNGFPHLYTRNYQGQIQYSSRSRGFSVTGFYGSDDKNGKLRVPPYSIMVSKNFKTFTRINKTTYTQNGVLDSANYYKKILSLSANDDKYAYRADLAVDEKNNHIALYDGKTIYIYDLLSIKNAGNVNPIYSISGIGSNQGFDINGNYLYLITGGQSDTMGLNKYDITTGKLVKSATFDLNSYYKNTRNSATYEPEGVSIYNNKIYIGCLSKKCMNDSCTSTRRFFDIHSVTGL